MAMKAGITCADIYCVLLQRNKGREKPQNLTGSNVEISVLNSKQENLIKHVGLSALLTPGVQHLSK